MSKVTRKQKQADNVKKILDLALATMVGSESKIAIAYLFMLLIMRKMQCSENRQNVKGALLLRKIKIPSCFENIRIDRVAAPYMLNGSPHSEALKREDPYNSN